MRIFFIFFLIFFINCLSAQNRYPTNYFNLPIDRKYSISSNFGEIRPSHFHAGLDYGTNMEIGINIYAIGDGYVSRVKVSSKGYGNAIYITHPNGYVSVYAHLSRFLEPISDYVVEMQHETQQFELDTYLYPGEFIVKKGQIIGKSGNSGRSFGPHLHFEIRDEITEEPINPLLFGYSFTDTEAPRIGNLYMYSFAQGKENHKYMLSEKVLNPGIDTIRAFGTVGFSIGILDYMAKKSKQSFGTFKIEMFIDDSLHFKYEMDRISFDESKYLNSFVDYDLYRDEGLKVTKCFIEPNNKLGIYKSQGNGLFNFSDGLLHKVKIVGTDYSENSGELNFYVQSDSSMILKALPKSWNVVKEISCNKPSEFKTDSFRISFSDSSLYYDIDLRYSKSKIGSKSFSDYHHIHSQNIPIHVPATIAIKPYQIPANLKGKSLIVGIGRNQHLFSAGGSWNNDFIETKISSFGSYYVTIDTIPPRIQPIGPKKKKNKHKQPKAAPNILNFEISDNLSGIDDYVVYIDNNWVLFVYDEKNRTISCNMQTEFIEHGEHELVIWVRDKLGNIETYESKFIY